MQRITQHKTSVILFFLVLIVYLSNLYGDYTIDRNKNETHRNLVTSSDVVANTFLPYMLLNEHTLTFDGIVQYLRLYDSGEKIPYFLTKVGGHYYSSYPILTGIVAVPIYALPLLLGKIPALQYQENIFKILILGRLTASLYTALTVVILYNTLKQLPVPTKDSRWPLIFTLFYAFGTTSWSISSRSLWQHTTAALFITAALYFFVLDRQRQRNLVVSGLLLSLATVARPTNIFLLVALGIYVLIWHRKNVFAVALASATPLITLCLYNWAVFGAPLSDGYGTRGDVRWTTPVLSSLLGYTLSPARSFLFVSPPLLLGVYYLARLLRHKRTTLEQGLLLFGLGSVCILLTYCKWYTWDGASGFGYRMLTDFIPLIVICAYMMVTQLSHRLKVLVIMTMLYSVILQTNAVLYLRSRCRTIHNWSFYCIVPKILNQSGD